VQTIVPPDVSLYDFFGSSLDVDGDRLIVGSTGAGAGLGYVYEVEDGQWIETARLEAPAGVIERFGLATYLSGDAALIKAVNPAAVFQYERRDEGWQLVGIVEPQDPLTFDDCFGCAGAARADWIFLSAYYDDSVSHEGGSVFAFRKRPDCSFEFVQKIQEAGTRRFGIGIDFDGQTLAIGASLTERDVEFQGVLYTYAFDGERWGLEQEVTHADPDRLDQFGSTVVVRGDRMLLGAIGDTSPPSVAGRVYQFVRNTEGVWVEAGTLEINPPVIARNYGVTMAMAEERALIGASREVDELFRDIGAAYFFDLSCGSCTPDLDLDGSLTIFDFLLFSNLFQDGDAQADFDGDGELTLFDFLAFQSAFDGGC
jgi:hypothetical protein